MESGYRDRDAMNSTKVPPGEPREGLVIAVRPRWVMVRIGAQELRCSVPQRLRRGVRHQRTPLAVGDRVIVVIDARGTAVPVELLARRSRISRLGSLRPPLEHVIAANVDQLLALQAVDEPPFNPGALDRLLLLGEAGGVECAIGLNKIDLVTPEEIVRLLAPYRASGYPIFSMSAVTEEGLPELSAFLAGHETVLLGPSGVGKSTLLNRLVPGILQTTAAVSHATGRGVHTTTRVDYLDLPAGGAVVDTPGLRTIQPFGLRPAALAPLYPEFRPYLGGCHFGDCLHEGEPGCAVTEAVAQGKIARVRHDSYVRVLTGLRLEGVFLKIDPDAERE
ncbi:MAG: ribosome small subunit-dependent GTPase A [Candidatus Eisenbacteria bacterium]